MWYEKNETPGKEVVLTKEEQVVAAFTAFARTQACQEANVRERKVCNGNPYDITLDGYGAELAYCKLMNLYPDFHTGPRQGGFDCVARNGERIDVKSTPHPNGHLIAISSKHAGDSDVYVLMVGKFPRYVYKGWAYASDLLKAEKITKLGNYQAPYAMAQEDLQFGGPHGPAQGHPSPFECGE